MVYVVDTDEQLKIPHIQGNNISTNCVYIFWRVRKFLKFKYEEY